MGSNSNIVFESNIYPIAPGESVHSDKKFLSKVLDYNRLYALKKNFSHIEYKEIQARIFNQQPVCSLNKPDPCWGPVFENGHYVSRCKCTKTSCKEFENCRKSSPYDEREKELFEPMEDKVSELYGYESFIKHNSAFPVDISSKPLKDYKPDEATSSMLFSVTSSVYDSEDAEQKKTDLKDDICDIATKTLESEGEHDNSQIDVVEKPSTKHESKETKIAKGTRQLLSHVPLSVIAAMDQEKIEDSFKDEMPAETEPEEVENSHGCDVDIHKCSTEGFELFEHFIEDTQESVIMSNPNENTFVDAGPGTGKTYTLIHKLDYMVTEQGVDPMGILVLCFTNAAVDEIKKRLVDFVNDGADRGLINIDVRTFHSFAWWLINQANESLVEEGWGPVKLNTLSYDGSLATASQIISKFGEIVVGNWEHFIVDEVQDLTNTLARFDLYIVQACIKNSCGLTVFGDACQAIYDYTSNNTDNPMRSEDFYRALLSQLDENARLVFLTENHRQTNELIKITEPFRTAILSGSVEKMRDEVIVLNNKLSSLDVEQISFLGKETDGYKSKGSICMLLRNNGQTLKMSSDLRKRGVNHLLNITETKNNYAPWITDVFYDFEKKNIYEDEFKEKLKDSPVDSDILWERMQAIMHSRNDVLNIRELLDSIAVSKADDAIFRVEKSGDIIVSNIHRSKGREYETVIINQPFIEELCNNVSDIGEYKTLYVAATRSKSELLLSQMQNGSGMKYISIFNTGRKRWGKIKRRQLTYLEFDGNKDIDINASSSINPAVFDSVEPGDAVYFDRKINDGQIAYDIVHEKTGNVIGIVGKSYIEDFYYYMQLSPDRLIDMPASIDNIYVSDVYSQVVDDEYLEENPEVKSNAKNGVWKWAELVGIGHAKYDVY